MMDGWEILKEAGELEQRGQAFALATVVWRQGPSSSQQGARAIITADGELHGWIGGACAEPTVIREAQRVIADGTPRLLLLGSPGQFGAAVPEGMTVVPISCQSEGALEVYIEQAVAARPAYVGLVGSYRRGAAVLGYLADRGLPADQLDRVRVPAGLDLGHITHQEIAVAILAELVQLRASGALAGAAGAASARNAAAP